MPHLVTFDEEDTLNTLPVPTPERRGISKLVMRLGIVNSLGEATIVLAVTATVLISLSFYLIASSLPPQPSLGADSLQPGETLPDYIAPGR